MWIISFFRKLFDSGDTLTVLLVSQLFELPNLMIQILYLLYPQNHLLVTPVVSGLSVLRLLSLLDLSSTFWSTFLLPSALWCRRGGSPHLYPRPPSWLSHDQNLSCCCYLMAVMMEICQIYMWNLRIPQISCELLFPIPGSDVAWAWCKPHFFTNIQRTHRMQLPSVSIYIYFLYIAIIRYIFIDPWNFLFRSRSGTDEMCLLHGSGTWTCPRRRWLKAFWNGETDQLRICRQGKWQLYLWVCSAAGVPGPNLL